MAPPKFTPSDTMKFIQLYRDQECLWFVGHVCYRARYARDRALASIQNGMDMPGLSIEDVKCKIKYLRATFMLERNKMLKSQKTGEIYVPTLKWYEEMAAFISTNPLSLKEAEDNVSVEGEDYEELLDQSLDNQDSRTSPAPDLERPRKRARNSDRDDNDDEFAIFGKHVASQLRQLTIAASLCAQEEIQSVLTRCRLNDLQNQTYE